MLKFAQPLKVLPSLITLIAANLIPLYGVLFHNWNISSIMFLYWAESAIIGGFTLLKIMRSEGGISDPMARIAEKGFFLTFFPIHYGIFMLVHGILLIVFFNPWQPLFGEPSLATFSLTNVFFSFLSLLGSHTVSYFTNYIGKGEYKRLSASQLFIAPYPRIIVMHLTIIFGSIFISTQGQSAWAVGLMIVLKIIADVGAHLFEHRQAGS